MATLAVSAIPGRTGINLTDTAVAADAALSDKFLNTDGNVYLAIVNGSGSPYTATFVFASGATIDGVAPANKTLVVAAGKTYIAGPFPGSTYNDANSFVVVNHSAVTSIKLLPFKVS